MLIDVRNSIRIDRTARVLQLESLFDVPPAERSEQSWRVFVPDVNDSWRIGVITGASGSGKSSLARQAFGDALVQSFPWDDSKSIVDSFDQSLSIKDITALLGSVGFNSPPSWLRPYVALSTGEKFRVDLARAMSEPRSLLCIDEFTSTVDRTVAQVGSAALAKAIRRSSPRKNFVAVSCHSDFIDWLQPDWVIEMPSGQLTRRSLQRRPEVDLEIRRVHPSAWEEFKRHHYLTGEQHPAAKAFCAFWKGIAVGYCSVIHFPHPVRSAWREHRVVVHPDYQGLGIGNRLSEFVASLFVCTGKPYRDTTSHPGHVHHRMRSKLWKVMRKAGLKARSASKTLGKFAQTNAFNRLTMSFEYVGPGQPEIARRMLSDLTYFKSKSKGHR